MPSTNCLNNGVQKTKNYRCANLVCLNQGVHPRSVCEYCARLRWIFLLRHCASLTSASIQIVSAFGVPRAVPISDAS